MLQVEIAGKRADRYRAYGIAKLLRSPSAEDHYARALAGKPPYPKRTKIEYDGEEPLIEDEVAGDLVKIKSKGKPLTRVVFYIGKGDEETVVGAVDVDGSGPFEIQLVEAPDPNAVTIVRE